MILSHIVAVSKNFIIGSNNNLPWKMPSDAKYFHDITMGHVVIMGRKNYEANIKALPERTNIVITRSVDFLPEDAIVVHSIEEAVKLAESLGETEAFFVGGGEIYKQSLDWIDRIYITVIDNEFKGDVSYPKIDFKNYTVISREAFKADEKNPYDLTYWVLGTFSL